MKTVFLGLMAFASLQLAQASTLNCSVSGPEGVQSLSQKFIGAETKIKLGSKAGFKIEVAALSLGKQSVISAQKKDLKISSASAGEVVNLRFQNEKEIVEILSQDESYPARLMGFDIEMSHLGDQSVIVASRGNLKMSSASAGRDVSNLRIERDLDVWEIFCSVKD
ncbi:MAG: hypothetical protein AB7I27_12730 [Bacteriovoracaceae bacterium]